VPATSPRRLPQGRRDQPVKLDIPITLVGEPKQVTVMGGMTGNA
jgi:hypothetical protein